MRTFRIIKRWLRVGICPHWMLGWQVVPSMIAQPAFLLQLFIIPAVMIEIGLPSLRD